MLLRYKTNFDQILKFKRCKIHFILLYKVRKESQSCIIFYGSKEIEIATLKKKRKRKNYISDLIMHESIHIYCFSFNQQIHGSIDIYCFNFSHQFN